MRTVSIHQSQYLPWPPYFKKIAQSDIFVFLDNVQYQKNGVQNRNKIRNKENDFWITIPVNKSLEDINKKKVTDVKILHKHWKSIEQCYSKSRNWGIHNEKLYSLFQEEHTLLVDINQKMIDFFVDELDIETKLYFASQLDVAGESNHLLVDICNQVGGTQYYSGTGAFAYLDERVFNDNNIIIKYQKSEPPIYKQAYEDFIPGLSMLDYLFNCSTDEMNNYIRGE